ncbi:hypothetical protein [Bermanella sp. R86510]|uniref:hypothetical protein n=1 Tax=unclassified Bermanella TaxID=2627862 RepID=UPI0037CBD27E
MDIMGLSKRMFDHLGQMSTKKTNQPQEVTKPQPAENKDQVLTGSLSQQLKQIAQRFDVNSLPVSDVLPLQQALKESGLVNDQQVRAQGLLTQLAYHHYDTGPMNVETALQEHMGRLKERPTVLADHKESQHLLNVVKNLQSARQNSHAA